MNKSVRASRRIDLYLNMVVVATWFRALALDRLSIAPEQNDEVGREGPGLL